MPRVVTTPREQREKRQAEIAGQIRREALAAGASSILLCSQAYGELQKALKEEDQGGGVCRSLVLAWLGGRKTGKNFLTRLLGPGGTVNKAEVLPLVQAYVQNKNLSDQEERALMTRTLQADGLSYTGFESELANTLPSAGAWCTQNSDHAGMGQYRCLNTRGGYNHAMGADLSDPNYAIFFDPNWGAFTFPQRTKMVDFLNKSMLVRSGQETLYGDAVNFHYMEKVCFS